MKLHWCCGDVYLKDYINIDIKGTLAKNLKTNPNETTLERYYKKPFISNPQERKRGNFIVDSVLDILMPWPFEDDSINKIVMISCWEHFFPCQINFIKREVERVLKKEGRLIVDFPDIKKDIELYYDSNPEFLMELLYCNGKDDLSIHKWGYTVNSFKALWSDKFIVKEKTIVQHDYPMIGMEVVKL
jgi:SAM-dependent methyltransferase